MARLAPGRREHLGSAGRIPDGQGGPAMAQRAGRAERWEEGRQSHRRELRQEPEAMAGKNNHQNIPLVPSGGELQTGVADVKM